MPSIDDFKKAVFMGDSLTVGLGQAVSGITTYATVGQTVWDGAKEHADKIISAKPSMIIISYGTNDAGYDNPSKYVNEFKSLITKFKNAIPNVQIYINKLFPGNTSKPKCTSGYKTAIKNIPTLNGKLSEIAAAGATVIDCTSVINVDSHYSEDGLHLLPAGYKAWYEEMQKAVTNGSGGGIQRKIMPASLDGTSYKSKKQTNTFIVVHNTAGRQYDNVSTAAKTVQYFHTNEAKANTSAHYCIDDKEIYQILENDWKGHHTTGKGYHEEWGITKHCGGTNSNSIGIEVADGPNVDHNKAIENLIELCRHLMKEMNIGIDNVVRHADTQDKDCPWTIYNLGKWSYI